MKFNKDIFIKGENVSLRILNETDVQGNYAMWLNDAEVTLYNSHGRFPMTVEKLKEYVLSSYSSLSVLVFAVIDNESNEHIGNVSLQGISWVDRSAEIAFLLGEKKYWGKGVMYEAGKLLMQHGFKMLNLHRIYCGTSSKNVPMQKLAAKLLMREEGVRREAIYKNGIYEDVMEYGILSHEFIST